MSHEKEINMAEKGGIVWTSFWLYLNQVQWPDLAQSITALNWGILR